MPCGDGERRGDGEVAGRGQAGCRARDAGQWRTVAVGGEAERLDAGELVGHVDVAGAVDVDADWERESGGGACDPAQREDVAVSGGRVLSDRVVVGVRNQQVSLGVQRQSLWPVQAGGKAGDRGDRGEVAVGRCWVSASAVCAPLGVAGPAGLADSPPHADRPVEPSGGEGLTVGTERDAEDGTGACVERREWLVTWQTP